MCSKSAFVPFLIWHVKSLAFWLCASWLLALQSKLSLWGNWSLWRFPWWWMNSETCVHACVCVFTERLARIGAWWQDSLSSCEVRRGLRSACWTGSNSRSSSPAGHIKNIIHSPPRLIPRTPHWNQHATKAQMPQRWSKKTRFYISSYITQIIHRTVL